MSNPFNVLGLTPNMVSKLEDELLMEAVKRNYRLLSRVAHPDVGGKNSDFRELALAYSRLTESTEAFSDFREEYLKPRKERLQELLEENDELGKRLVRTNDQLYEFVTATARKGGIVLPGGLLMYDSLNVAISGEVSNRPGSVVDRAKEKATFDLHQEGSSLIKTPLSFSKHQAKSQLVPNYYRDDQFYTLVKSTVVGKSAISYAPVGKSQTLNFVPIGVVSVEDDAVDGRSLKKALAITGVQEDFSRARSGYSWEAFQHLLPSLTTRVDSERYLVGVRTDEKGVRFILIGKILAIAR